MAVASCSVGALRSIVQDSLGKHLYDNAIFFADKLVALSGGAPDDVYRLAQAYVFTKQWRRALALLRKHNLSPGEPRFRYLTAKCLAEAQEWDECLSLLGDDVLQVVANADGGGIEGQVGMHAAMQLLKGSVYELQENWPTQRPPLPRSGGGGARPLDVVFLQMTPGSRANSAWQLLVGSFAASCMARSSSSSVAALLLE